MDDAPTTKDAILERTRSAASAIDRVVGGMTDDDLLASPPGGGWSVRDMLAHMSADLRWFAAQMEASLEGRAPTAREAFTREDPPDPPFDLSTQDGRNAAQYEINRHLSLDEVRQNWRRYRERVEGVIRRIPDAEFSAPYTIAPLDHVGHVRRAREDEEGWPLWRWIAGNTWHHFEDHLKDIKARA